MVDHPRLDLPRLVKGVDRAAQDAHPQLAVQDVIAVLAVVQQSQPIGPTADRPTHVYPGLARLLVTVVPTLDAAVGDGGRDLCVLQGQGKGQFQHGELLVPVDRQV